MKQGTPKQHVELINDNIEEFDKAIKLFKQETLEEAAEKCFNYIDHRNTFIAGAKWQMERSYSEEEVLKLILTSSKLPFANDEERIDWFEQFKKK